MKKILKRKIEKFLYRKKRISAKSDPLFEKQIKASIAEINQDVYKQMELTNSMIKEIKEEIKEEISVIARQVAFLKWQRINTTLQEKETDIVTCTICGYAQKRAEYEVKEADCIFGGGHLIRYICPHCNVVFGPTKFLNMSQAEVDEDYKLHYMGFSEGDSTKNEERAFFMLHPNKKGIYLNYGCGHWSNSLQNLRSQGYQVYGYEPYASDSNHPYMITKKETLLKMRFDGIYSNNLLEHLLHPVEDLIFMRRLLLGGGYSMMAHCTPCYQYKYEYTRFHTHFFLGDSVNIMSEKCKLEIADVCNDTEESDFFCYVFAPKANANNLTDVMFLKGDGERKTDGRVVLQKNSILYGPYLTLQDRSYELHIKIRGKIIQAKLKITSKCGSEILKEVVLSTGENLVTFELVEVKENMEFFIQNEGESLEIESICLSGNV